jgi:hypothetical protein
MNQAEMRLVEQGWEALVERLGPEEAVRFVMLLDRRTGAGCNTCDHSGRRRLHANTIARLLRLLPNPSAHLTRSAQISRMLTQSRLRVGSAPGCIYRRAICVFGFGQASCSWGTRRSSVRVASI